MGLLKTAAKVAVASSVHGRIQRRQQRRWAAQDAAGSSAVPPTQAEQPTATAAAVPADRLAQLTQLGELRAAGVLTEDEFQREKGRILAS